MSLTVDLHHHVIPDFYWEASNESGDAAGGITPRRWSLDGAIAYLDEAGIDLAVASISTPSVHFGDDAAAHFDRSGDRASPDPSDSLSRTSWAERRASTRTGPA